MALSDFLHAVYCEAESVKSQYRSCYGQEREELSRFIPVVEIISGVSIVALTVVETIEKVKNRRK